MPVPDVGEFRWADAWLLLAAGLAHSAGRDTLAHVIGAADAIQHTIPTKAELDGGISRLRRAGYLEFSPDGVRPTEAGRTVLAQAERAGRQLLRQQDAVERLLGARAWAPGYDPLAARGGEPELLTAEEYDAAVRGYFRTVGHRR